MALKPDEDGRRGYRINALGQLSLPPTAFSQSNTLQDMLSGRVHPRVTERLDRLSSLSPEASGFRQDLLMRMLQATASTSVSFQERLFDEEPVEEDVISFSINDAGDVTILLG